MDLRAYYQKIREVEATLEEPFVVLSSLATPEGGKEGVRSEVAKSTAAKYIAEGRARLSTPEEVREFHQQKQTARKEAERLETAGRIQFAVLPESELGNWKSSSRGSK